MSLIWYYPSPDRNRHHGLLLFRSSTWIFSGKSSGIRNPFPNRIFPDLRPVSRRPIIFLTPSWRAASRRWTTKTSWTWWRWRRCRRRRCRRWRLRRKIRNCRRTPAISVSTSVSSGPSATRTPSCVESWVRIFLVAGLFFSSSLT